MESDHGLYQDEGYRDSLATVDSAGKRIWLYPKIPHGFYTIRRHLAAYLFLGILVAIPFVTIHGRPLLRINIFEREFIIFGNYFFPQDFLMLAVGLILFFVFIILFTVVFGRLFCGWACPQTVFMESVFRRIEFWLEGDANERRKLDASDWDFNKIWRKSIKHILFIVIATGIGQLVMTYLIGVPKTIQLATHSPWHDLPAFIALVAFSVIFYGVFAFMREQICTSICPYGRLQSVLLTKESIVVIYDYLRGEPREKIHKNEVRSAGSCVDCKLCVQVCPTGIDIRNGTQLECINCTACIDACNTVMDKVGFDRGLIRYDSKKGVDEGITFQWTTRILMYSLLLIALIGIELFMILSRSDIEATVMRVPGLLFQKTKNGQITNLYNVQIVNKTPEDIDIVPQLNHNTGKISLVGGKSSIKLKAASATDATFFIELNPKTISTMNTKIEIDFLNDKKVIESSKTSFIAPIETE